MEIVDFKELLESQHTFWCPGILSIISMLDICFQQKMSQTLSKIHHFYMEYPVCKSKSKKYFSSTKERIHKWVLHAPVSFWLDKRGEIIGNLLKVHSAKSRKLIILFFKFISMIFHGIFRSQKWLTRFGRNILSFDHLINKRV